MVCKVHRIAGTKDVGRPCHWSEIDSPSRLNQTDSQGQPAPPSDIYFFGFFPLVESVSTAYVSS
jgi:hypothetical protein